MLDVLVDGDREGLFEGGEATEMVSQHHFFTRFVLNHVVILLYAE